MVVLWVEVGVKSSNVIIVVLPTFVCILLFKVACNTLAQVESIVEESCKTIRESIRTMSGPVLSIEV